MALQSEAVPHRGVESAWTWPASSRAWYSVVVLSLVSMMSNIDRGIVNLLVGPIKRDLHLSDTSISLLIGLTFSFAYVLFSFPLSRLADSKSRKVILTTGLTLWSLASMLCGLAQQRVDHRPPFRLTRAHKQLDVSYGKSRRNSSPATLSRYKLGFRPDDLASISKLPSKVG